MTGWNPKRTLPSDWGKRRADRLEFDGYVCQLQLEGICTDVATEVHHVNDPNSHEREDLLSVCSACHEHETRLQSAAAVRAGWAQTRPRPRKHPGLL